MTTDADRLATLERILAGFNAHDAAAIVADFTHDAVFDAPRGAHAGGTRYTGREAIRLAFEQRFAGIPDIRYEDDRHFVAGDRGVSEWTIRGHSADGSPIEVRGCDLWEFDGATVRRKDSYWKRLDP
jgi:ketosteroid isomerase-like protein